jgi:hypothetical protein
LFAYAMSAFRTRAALQLEITPSRKGKTQKESVETGCSRCRWPHCRLISRFRGVSPSQTPWPCCRWFRAWRLAGARANRRCSVTRQRQQRASVEFSFSFFAWGLREAVPRVVAVFCVLASAGRRLGIGDQHRRLPVRPAAVTVAGRDLSHQAAPERRCGAVAGLGRQTACLRRSLLCRLVAARCPRGSWGGGPVDGATPRLVVTGRG